MGQETALREPQYDFDYMRDPTLLADVHEGYWRLKHHAPPVFWTPHNGGHWVVTEAEMAIEVLRHPERFSSRFLTIPPNPDQPRMIPESLDPPEHRAYRQLLRPFFESKAIAALEPGVTAWAERLIDAVAPRGECEFVDAVGSRFPVSVFMELFGFPLEQFALLRGIVVEYFDPALDAVRRGALSLQILSILGALIEARRLAPRDDLISTLVHIEFAGRRLTQDELLSIGFLMFLAGLDTVVNALTFGMRHLASDRALRETLIADPQSVPSIVDELMRRYAFVSTPRFVVDDTRLGRADLKAGDSVLVPLAMVGWDENLTACPQDVRIDRPHCRHAAFGSGVHTCLGIHLARLEMAVFYRTWARKIGHFRVIDKGPLRFRGGSVQAIEALHLAWDHGSKDRNRDI